MIAQILRHFPPHTHPLTLVSDPDGLLADEELLAALAERGFSLVDESAPVALRRRVEAARPFSADRALIVVTAGPLNTLPYDLWAQGHPVTLALHTFFPGLAYPVVRALSPAQRWRLSQSPPPPRRLGQRRSITYVLRHVFGVDFESLARPAGLITWLNDYHQRADAMPPLLADYLLADLRPRPVYAGWPLDQLLHNHDAFVTFLREQWLTYVQGRTGQPAAETRLSYTLPFGDDARLQDTLPRLVRSGALSPVPVPQPERLPPWARLAVLARHQDLRPRRAAELLAALSEHLESPLADARWDRWQVIARRWAELQALRYDPDAPQEEAACAELETRLDRAFLEWLRHRYAPLGTRYLPLPQHLYHVPHYIAYQRRQGQADRIALLILDGMALSDWTLIGPVWRARHPDWRFHEHLLLAQIPTITVISRQALVSGQRLADFAATLHHLRAEPQHWAAFWRTQEGLATVACPYAHLALERDRPPPPAINSVRTHALCLIDSSIDGMMHGASQGTAGLQASLRLWLDRGSKRLEEVIATLLKGGFTLYLTSDHGHTQARGLGQPSEGLTVKTRSKRARVYADRHAAEKVAERFPETLSWSQDGLLPDHVWTLMPQGRRAFAILNETVVTHGGPTLDEVVVPLVTIKL
jgi:hypothetical protein